ncbi:pyridoxamine 5'-phosphate oxidase family protein [Actinobacteria bacterium YIM 96077]|uniref:Pyridoxamine 5'-phosphate oxidase family protein n=1 Tax=Phytoactinopolyspora halophila TaxID=1981511 RepID=A0A329R6D6_9ACTN|nr:pyridoxamine 5'-phosphate oxidase family protein [Phytoactinopolyspora halophila]AYY15199.1 pyridoxamine 5'-phosphate oxidase family protein [Actinobacteria bacterium YIM 96077]RAW19002.1 pyridoxamine 5'-phosphate oxidase family protein [Phytoactinopolyspora halophila]
MATWKQFSEEAPKLAAAVQARLEFTKHHVLATLRGSGAPRVSGTEVDFHGDHLTLGSMLDAVKARDLQRDPRYALHTNPGDGSMDGGDAKISGRAVEVPPERMDEYLDRPVDAPGSFHMFLLEIDDVVLTGLNDEKNALVIQLWRPGEPVQTGTRQ